MPLPDCIEIEPIAGPIRSRLTVPGSKSITNRALILAALAQGESRITGALWSEDTQVMVDGLKQLGFSISVESEPEEPCNRTLTVLGHGGRIPESGSPEQPLELYVGNAGTAARFLTALVCLGDGVYRLSGSKRMHERPQQALFEALRELGYRIEPEQEGDRLPARIFGTGPRKSSCTVGIDASSQFASALLLCERVAQWDVRIVGENDENAAYIRMTREVREQFSSSAGAFHVEPDASGGSYFWAISWLMSRDRLSPVWLEAAPIQVAHWPQSGWQIDAGFPKLLPLPSRISRMTDLGDSIMTAIVLAPFAASPVEFIDLGRLRLQECDRVQALHEELGKCGVQSELFGEGDSLRVPAPQARLTSAEIETYDDHRIAMCFATLALKTPGIRIRDPGCVRKTFPDFFQKLASPPPDGLGASIYDATEAETFKKPLDAAELLTE